MESDNGLGDTGDAASDAIAPDVTPDDLPGGTTSGRTVEDVATILDVVVEKLDSLASAVLPASIEEAADETVNAVAPDTTPTGVPWTHFKPWSR